MTDYSENVVRRGALWGQVSSLVINSLSSLTADYVDVTKDDNFYRVLSAMVQISSSESSPNELSLNGHIRLRKNCANQPPDPGRPVDVFPRPCQTHSGHDNPARGTNLPQSNPFPLLPGQ